MDDAALEHRLTLIEAAQINASSAAITQHSLVMSAIGEVKGKVDTINGTVQRHDQELAAHGAVPHSAVDHEASRMYIDHINEMWTAWSIGKWVGAAGVLALIGQTTALLLLVLRGG